jgi:hypothetical protein
VTDTTSTTDRRQLFAMSPGDTFTFRGRHFVLTGFGRTNAKIALVDEPTKHFNLKMTAFVEYVGVDNDALRAALVQPDGAGDVAAFKPGDKVRFVANTKTRNAGLAGTESVVVRVNQKTVGLANGYRVSPTLLEAV